jgi:hypothetical protein
MPVVLLPVVDDGLFLLWGCHVNGSEGVEEIYLLRFGRSGPAGRHDEDGVLVSWARFLVLCACSPERGPGVTSQVEKHLSGREMEEVYG